MARTHRAVYLHRRHDNAIPYKRTPRQVLFKGEIGDVEITIERDNSRKAQY